jgi:hypothetical protein
MMPRKPKDKLRKYRFKIEAYSPETMPLGRLAEYLADLAIVFGEDESVHLIEIEEGSTVAAFLVNREAEPKILDQLSAVEREEAPPEVMRASARINERLRKDNGKGEIISPKNDNLIVFPGCEQEEPLVYGPFTQPGVVIGIPRAVGGDNDPVPVHIKESDGRTQYCLASEEMARDIAAHLFLNVIRAEGMARWARNAAGEWMMEKFRIKTFTPLSDASLRETINGLRAIPAEWKHKEDPLSELRDIRHGTDG